MLVRYTNNCEIPALKENMHVWNTPYDQWKLIHFARLNLSSEVVTAAILAQIQTSGYVLSLHQTKSSFCERFIHGEKPEKAMWSLLNTCLSLSSFHDRFRYSDFGVWLPSHYSEDGCMTPRTFLSMLLITANCCLYIYIVLYTVICFLYFLNYN